MVSWHQFSRVMAVLALSGSIVGCSPTTSPSSSKGVQTQAPTYTNLVNTMDELLQESHDRNLLNGNVLIAKHGNVIYEKSFGYTRGEKTEKLTAQSIFNTGSIAKEFNAAAIMILVERNQLNLDDSISDYLTGFPDWSDDIQIKHLLNYTSGLPPINWNSVKTPADVMADLMALNELPFKPGEGYVYSNNNVLFQRLIIEAATGQLFPISRMLILSNPQA